MSRFNCRTRGNASPQGKPNVYFCCHPADVSCFDEIAGDILRFQNCAIWYREDPARPEDISTDSCPADPDTYFCDLSRMQLFVIPVTSSFLCEPNRARDTDLPYALEHHIPILPLLQEDGLESLFNQTCGDFQILNKYTKDPTALDFYQKLERFLSDVLIPDDLADKIRAAFDAYVFLSYRKKDRKYAQQLMRLIHQNEFCRDIAIWYDEFLIPGENFNDSIAAALEQSSLFALAVTPNLVNEPNYVMSIEYPMAKEAKKTVLPFELVPTDKKDLEEKFTELPACTDVRDMSALSATLLEAVTSLAIRENDASPEHLFFIGLAYLAGIDVEVDCEQALALISRAAGQGLPEAMEKLVHMYKNGIGVPRDFLQAISWQKRLIQAKRRQYAAAPSSSARRLLALALLELADLYQSAGQLTQAAQTLDDALDHAGEDSGTDCGDEEQRFSLLALVFHRMGTVSLALQDFSSASAQFDAALSWNQRLLPYSDRPVLRRNIFSDYCYLGRIALKQGQPRKAIQYLTDGTTVLGTPQLDNIDMVQSLSSSWLLRGDAHLSLGRETDAEADYRSGIAVLEDLYQSYQAVHPDAVSTHFSEKQHCAFALCTASSRLFLLYLHQKQYEPAQDILRDCFALLSPYSSSAAPAEQKLLAALYNHLGALRKQQGEYAEAEQAFVRAVSIYQDLPQPLRNNGDILHCQSNNLAFLTDLCAKQGRLSDALAHCIKNIAACEKLAALTQEIDDRRMLSVAYAQAAGLHQKNRNLSAAEDFYQKCLLLREEIAQTDMRLRAKTDLSTAYYNFASLKHQGKKYAQAGELFQKSVGLDEQIVQESPTIAHWDTLADGYYLLGCRADLYHLTEYARAFLEQAASIRQALCEQDPDSPVLAQKYQEVIKMLT